MRKFLSEKVFCNIFNVLAILMFAVLFYYCLGLTGKNKADLSDEFIYFETESIIWNFVIIFISIKCLSGIGKISAKLRDIKNRNIVLGIVCVLTAIISFWWIFACKAEPYSDQLLICYYANDFNQGDFSGLMKGGYVAVYPQQLGMITLLRIILALFGSENYMAFKCLSAASVPLLVFSGCKIVRILSNDNVRAEIYYLLCVLFCFPMYVYTAFVYGDLISTAISLLGVWMFLSCLKRWAWKKLLLFGISIGVAVALRKNVLILVAALGIVSLVKFLFCRSRKNFTVCMALFLGVLVMHLPMWWIYHDVRPDDAAAIPASLFIVMGLNDDYGHAGWYNDYHYATFEELEYDLERANAKAYGELHNYFEAYLRDPHAMLDFFVRKMNAQWNAPMYQCIVMNSRIEGEQPAVIDNIYRHGKGAKIIESGMKLYQLLLYGSILFLLITRRKNTAGLEGYTLLIAVFGGFLFSLMWEAKTRYIFPYLLMQIPYMAIGLNEMVSALERRSIFAINGKARAKGDEK